MNTASPNHWPRFRQAFATKPARLNVSRELAFEEQSHLVRSLIWLYLILWLTEGGLRRWFFPSLAMPLLLVRDPVLMAIYLISFQRNLFRNNTFIFSGLALAFLTFANAIVMGHGNPLVALYGLRCDFFHVPLIFIIGRVIRQKDLLAVAKAAVWLSIPNTMLLVAQFYSPQDAWVNRGVGGSLDGAGFSGALGRFRPPGTFSFITGTAQLYTLVTACWFALVLARKFNPWLMIASGVSILVAVPVSVSRGLFLSVAVVAAAGIGSLFIGGRLSVPAALRALLAGAILVILASQLPAFKAGMEAFTARWESSTTENGGFQGAIIDRVLDDLFGAFKDAQLYGLGTGFSTNVGQKLLTAAIGFGASEGEWGRLLYDNGVVLGSLLILYRTALVLSISATALRAWRRRSPGGIVFASAACLQIFNGQWGQPTTLGSAVIAGGLALAAASDLPQKEGRQSAPSRTSKYNSKEVPA